MVLPLFIPLYIFILAEGVILYFLATMVITAFLNYDFLDNFIPPFANGTVFVFLLAIAVGAVIYLYIRFTIKPALTRMRERQQMPDKIRESEKKPSKIHIIFIIIGLVALIIVSGAAVFAFFYKLRNGDGDLLEIVSGIVEDISLDNISEFLKENWEKYLPVDWPFPQL